jgi:hypothetical protein
MSGAGTTERGGSFTTTSRWSRHRLGSDAALVAAIMIGVGVVTVLAISVQASEAPRSAQCSLLTSVRSKWLVGCYAMFAGIVFLVTASVMNSPVILAELRHHEDSKN